jgi:RNA polymerase sigma-70 factor (ECF subfamily)
LIRQLRDESEAADIAQETFTKVYLNRSKFRTETKFSTWFFTIATNLLRDHFRWQKRHPEVSLEAHEGEHQSLKESLPDASKSPGDQLISEERSKLVADAIQALPEDLRTALILSQYEEKSQAEIADIVNCSVKAVETRIYRARNLLRKSLASSVEA